ncbi:hypothetical protein [Paenibacillus xylanexedens]|uniref:hypothetical protein n=1 Tax=Paenibacillus xylanexedens TaxID=528191 RepID=UPI000F534177|nr:hypothetical protein [Paenibacillus xylanexedens]RPK20011.1 hypothetical protein EDO6_06528 [Paenibacillus xylanexedens]
MTAEKYNVNDYKFDDRTKEQFIKDLQDGLKKEVHAINIFREILKTSVVEKPEVIYVGSEEEGVVIYEDGNVANVDIFPDYLLKYKKHRRIRCNLVEVKVCNPHSKFAYFKKKQLEQYDELDNVVILFVMGISTDSPKFILVTPNQIMNMGIEAERVYGKETYRCNVDLFNWEKFSPIQRDYSLLDKKYIKE